MFFRVLLVSFGLFRPGIARAPLFLEGNLLAKEEEDKSDNGLSNVPNNLIVNTPSKFY